MPKIITIAIASAVALGSAVSSLAGDYHHHDDGALAGFSAGAIVGGLIADQPRYGGNYYQGGYVGGYPTTGYYTGPRYYGRYVTPTYYGPHRTYAYRHGYYGNGYRY